MDISEKVQALEEASSMLCDELGEYWECLASLYARRFDCASEEFIQAFDAEIDREYDRLKSEFVVVEEPVSVRRTVKTLRHIYD